MCVHTLQFSSFNPTLLGCKYELLKYTLKRNETETLFSHKDWAIIAKRLRSFITRMSWWTLSYFDKNVLTLTLGWSQWNLSRFEFKFDETRLSSWYKNKIGRIIFFCCTLTLLSLPCWLSQFRKAKLRQPTGQRQSNVRTQQQKI